MKKILSWVAFPVIVGIITAIVLNEFMIGFGAVLGIRLFLMVCRMLDFFQGVPSHSSNQSNPVYSHPTEEGDGKMKRVYITTDSLRHDRMVHISSDSLRAEHVIVTSDQLRYDEAVYVTKDTLRSDPIYIAKRE